MDRRVPVIGALGLLLALAAPAGAQLRYWGREPGSGRGVVEDAGRMLAVTPGVEIPAWGRVHEVGDQELVVDYHLSEADKAQLRAEGAAVVDVIRTRVLREDLRQIGPRR